jgi:S-methylmethionine-dependent homocysteine/selenocysteine methylase
MIVLDGAMGTELERRGIDTGLPLWSANALLQAPDAVRRIHADYLHAGAQVLTANTFRANFRTLARAGLDGRMRELVRLAISLARDAIAACRAPNPAGVAIAGSMAPVEDCYSPWLVPGDEELAREHAELARCLSEAGCDLILVETMNTVREAAIAARAAAATGLPVWVSFMLDEANRLPSGESLGDAVCAVLPSRPEAVLVNCIPVAQVPAALGLLRDALGADGPRRGAYANAGCVEAGGWSMANGVAPDAYGRAANAWIEQGAAIVGGCCGTTPDHIAAIARRPCQSPSSRVH